MTRVNAMIEDTNASELCHHLTLQTIKKVVVQNLDEHGSKHDKLRVTIKENQNAQFDAIYFIANSTEFGKLKVSDTNVMHAVVSLPGMYRGYNMQVLAIQIKEVFRVDEYAGACEELAKAFKTRPSLCVCKTPLFNSLVLSPRLIEKVEDLLGNLTLVVSTWASTCQTACLTANKGCQGCAFPLLNDQRFLAQPWRKECSFKVLMTGEHFERKLSDLRILNWRREGSGIQLRDRPDVAWDAFDLLQAECWRVPTCTELVMTGRPICPCY